MVDHRIAFGIVGAGRIAQSYVQAFRHAASARLVAIADIRAEAAGALAEAAGCRSYTSYRAMCEEAALDAVLVCTPPTTHAEISLHFLQHAVHVLCEKPLSLDLDNAVRLAETAQQAGVYLTMASKFRYVEEVIQAKRLATSGMLGDLVLFENVFMTCVDMTCRWNADPAISGGGVLIDNGTHSVDLMRYFLGPLTAVQAVEGKRSQGLDVEETVWLLVRSASGVMGRIDLSWSFDNALDSYIRIYGTQGTLAVGWKISRYRHAYGNQWHMFGGRYDKIRALCGEIENFAHTIRGEERLRIPTAEAVASVAVIVAAYTALRQNRWVTVAYPPSRFDSVYDYHDRGVGATA